jgi:hypothetical protein
MQIHVRIAGQELFAGVGDGAIVGLVELFSRHAVSIAGVTVSIVRMTCVHLGRLHPGLDGLNRFVADGLTVRVMNVTLISE